MPKFSNAALTALGLCISIEMAIWLSRATDVPTYIANDQIGYLPQPDQSGNFLWSARWAFNELSMGTPRQFRPSTDAFDVLLVGDSIVHGSNTEATVDRLGSVLQRQSGWNVWPISAPSWGLQNQLTYLHQHPEVVAGAERIIFVLNPTDLNKPSSWTSEFLHPLKKPFPATWFLIRKYILNQNANSPPPTPVQAWGNLPEELRKFIDNTDVPIQLYYYTFADLDGLPSTCESLPEAFRALSQWHCVSESPSWNSAMYKDGVHPTMHGTYVLASILMTS